MTTQIQVHSVNEVTVERVNYSDFATTTITATDKDGHIVAFVLFHPPGVVWFPEAPNRKASL